MGPVLEGALLFLLKKVITEDVVKQFEKQVVLYLKDLASKTDTKIDDFMVEVIAEALGVQL